MSRYVDNVESCLDDAHNKSHIHDLMILYLVKAFIWALLEIADAIRYSHE